MKKFGVGLILQVGIKILAAGLGFFTTRWLITTVSEADYAAYNVILGYNAALLMALWLGIPQIIQKYYTSEEDAAKLKDLWTTFALVRVGSYFLGLVIILLTYRLTKTDNIGLIMGLYTAQFILVADFAYRSVCDALGNAWKFSTTDFIGKLILVALLYSLSLLSSPHNVIIHWISRTNPTLDLNTILYPNGQLFGFAISPLTYFIAASIIAYMTAMITDALWNKKQTRFGKFDYSLLKTNFKPMFYLSASYASYALYYTTVPLFIKHFGYSDGVISGYANAYKFFEIASIVPGLTMPTIASMVKKQMKNGRILLPVHKLEFLQSFANSHRKYLIYLEWWFITLGIGVGTSLGLIVFGPIAIHLVDPQLLYPLAIPALRILALASIPQSIMYFSSTLNILADGERFELIASSILAVVALTLYSLLIGPFGIYGAVWSIVFIYCVDFGLKFYFLNRNYLSKPTI